MTETPASGNTLVRWSATKKMAFLFFVFYTIFYIFPTLFDFFTPLAGKYILHINNPVAEHMSGSGDTEFYYVRLFTVLLAALIVAPIIFIIDRKRNNYSAFVYWWFLILRYYIAAVMLMYGFIKVFKVQFNYPTLFTLEQTYGNSSPMHLMWTFMGYSTGYTFFSGMAEVTGGVLLLFRRTTTLGALVIIVVMGNVLMMNLFYDVPVKIFSAHLVFFSMLLLVPNARAVFNFFILGRTATLTHYSMPPLSKKLNIGRIILKGTVVFLMVGYFILSSYAREMQEGDDAPKHPLYGIYRTYTFILNKDTLPPLNTNAVRWDKLIIDRHNAKIISMIDSSENYKVNIDTTNKKINFISVAKENITYTLNYKVNGNCLILNGAWGKDSIQVNLVKKDITKYLLNSRGFHWINEFPYNR